jgi:hypothetical protein
VATPEQERNEHRQPAHRMWLPGCGFMISFSVAPPGMLQQFEDLSGFAAWASRAADLIGVGRLGGWASLAPRFGLLRSTGTLPPRRTSLLFGYLAASFRVATACVRSSGWSFSCFSLRGSRRGHHIDHSVRPRMQVNSVPLFTAVLSTARGSYSRLLYCPNRAFMELWLTPREREKYMDAGVVAAIDELRD